MLLRVFTEVKHSWWINAFIIDINYPCVLDTCHVQWNLCTEDSTIISFNLQRKIGEIYFHWRTTAGEGPSSTTSPLFALSPVTMTRSFDMRYVILRIIILPNIFRAAVISVMFWEEIKRKINSNKRWEIYWSCLVTVICFDNWTIQI